VVCCILYSILIFKERKEREEGRGKEKGRGEGKRKEGRKEKI
jgi:hypothetical protein